MIFHTENTNHEESRKVSSWHSICFFISSLCTQDSQVLVDLDGVQLSFVCITFTSCNMAFIVYPISYTREKSYVVSQQLSPLFSLFWWKSSLKLTGSSTRLPYLLSLSSNYIPFQRESEEWDFFSPSHTINFYFHVFFWFSHSWSWKHCTHSLMKKSTVRHWSYTYIIRTTLQLWYNL